VLRVFTEQQQKSLECEYEQSRKMKDKLKNMVCWFMKRENLYKESLNNLENENKKLQYLLTEMQRERTHIEVINNNNGKKQEF